MAFSAKQAQALRRDLDGQQIRTREANGRELSYIEGWYVVSEANRIFGFDGWSRETTETRCVLSRENRGTFTRSMSPKLELLCMQEAQPLFGKVTVREKAAGRLRVKSTTLHLKLPKPMQPSEHLPHSVSHLVLSFIVKVVRRTLRRSPQQALPGALPATRFGFHPDDTTPIPRPSHYYGAAGFRPLKQSIPQHTICRATGNLSNSPIGAHYRIPFVREN